MYCYYKGGLYCYIGVVCYFEIEELVVVYEYLWLYVCGLWVWLEVMFNGNFEDGMLCFCKLCD